MTKHTDFHHRGLVIALVVTAYVTLIVVTSTVGFAPITWVRAWLAAFFFVSFFNAFFDARIWQMVSGRFQNVKHGLLHAGALGILVPLWLTFLLELHMVNFWTDWAIKVPFAFLAIFVADLIVGKMNGRPILK